VQRPLHGVSMRYTFAAPDAPSARQTQLYEMPGARDSADRAEADNVAARYPEKVAELASQWAAAEGRPESRVLGDPGVLTELSPRLPARNPAPAR
jgi:hypothetical protein